MIARTRLSDDAFDLLGTTGREDLGDQLNLMAAKVSAPAFRDEIVEQHYRRMKAWYPTHDSSLQEVADKYLPRLIRSGDRRYGHDDLDSFLAPSVEDVRAWMEPQFRDGLIEVTVVGDVEKQVVVEEVARTFGALPERADVKQPFANMRSLVFPQDASGPHVFHHKGNAGQALVFVYWPGPDASDPADQYRMRLLREYSGMRRVLPPTSCRRATATKGSFNPVSRKQLEQTLFPPGAMHSEHLKLA